MAHFVEKLLRGNTILESSINFPRKIWRERGTQEQERSTKSHCSTHQPPPPVSAPTVNGFFPYLRWVFYAELVSEALTRHKMAAGVTDLMAEWRPEATEADEEKAFA